VKASLENRVMLVTGGSSGCGRAAAIELARQGAAVVIADIDVDNGEKAATTIREAGAEATFIETDVTSPSQVRALVRRTVAAYGRVDGAFNNAGLLEGTFTATTDCTEATWQRVMDVNLKGVWLCMKYQIRQMLEQGGGVIVNHASVAGLYGNRIVGPAYIASKHGVVGLTRVAALEYAHRGIRINAICPGIVDATVMSEAIFGGNAEREAQIKSLYPSGRVGSLDEVAATVAWLFSDGASFINGHALPVEGGLLAQ
jgi:NAD(P)-dependent dehydrogenase (short-subunit alcohol dehydrogenase family)